MEQTTKKCPYCGEEILTIAKKCKHCGEWIEHETQFDNESSNMIDIMDYTNGGEEGNTSGMNIWIKRLLFLSACVVAIFIFFIIKQSGNTTIRSLYIIVAVPIFNYLQKRLFNSDDEEDEE